MKRRGRNLGKDNEGRQRMFRRSHKGGVVTERSEDALVPIHRFIDRTRIIALDVGHVLSLWSDRTGPERERDKSTYRRRVKEVDEIDAHVQGSEQKTQCTIIR